MNNNIWKDTAKIEQEIADLAADLSGGYRPSYAQYPTDQEIASLSVGSLEQKIAVVMRLNDQYRDGWDASAALAGVAHYIHVTALPVAPAVNVPAEADVLRMMAHGLSRAQAVYALGGIN